MRSRSARRRLLALALIAAAVFVALTVLVTINPSLGLDSRAFAIAAELRAPWLTSATRVVTTLGLIAIVGPALVLGGGLLVSRGHVPRAAALVTGGALAWVSVWVAKSIIDRPRPRGALVHTAGQSYPSAHAANSVGWLALAIAVGVLIRAGAVRVAAITAGALLTALVGLSRIYLRAHFASDVIAGEALAVAMYAFATIAVCHRVGSDDHEHEEGEPLTEPGGAQASKETVVVAFDGSPAARRAVEEAARLFKSSRVLVVTVWEEGLAYVTASAPTEGMVMSPMVDPGVAMEVDRSVHEHAERVSQEGAALARSLDLDAQPLAVPDERDVARTILAVAAKHQAAAIVVGSRGLSGIRARLEGSTSKTLLKHSPCAVMVVHDDEEDR